MKERRFGLLSDMRSDDEYRAEVPEVAVLSEIQIHRRDGQLLIALLFAAVEENLRTYYRIFCQTNG